MGGTVGSITTYDFDNDGYLEFFVPNFDGNYMEIYQLHNNTVAYQAETDPNADASSERSSLLVPRPCSRAFRASSATTGGSTGVPSLLREKPDGALIEHPQQHDRLQLQGHQREGPHRSTCGALARVGDSRKRAPSERDH